MSNEEGKPFHWMHRGPFRQMAPHLRRQRA
jgi:hypothetical protein